MAQTKREAVMCQTDDLLASFGLDILENSAFSEFEEDLLQNLQQVLLRCSWCTAQFSRALNGGEVQRITSLRDHKI
jgi:hypothetical protein